MKEINFRAVIIEASAGTGKTYWITREFLNLIGKDNPASDIKKILAVTFSEKASIEMKTRILEEMYSGIFQKLPEYKKIELENAILRMRISTIHSFCRLLLKRFAFYKGIDPFFNVIDKRESILFSYRAFNKFLNTETSEQLLHLLKDFKLQTLKKQIFNIMEKHPYTTIGISEGILTEKIAGISKYINEISENIKRELSALDFNDLEIMTYNILNESPDALTILEDFDEKNNFIFVDEFQDTNLVQWKIIYKLVEDWISGYTAKTETGKPYGIFLVGDRKQSIYKFRGAEGKVFDEAKKVLNIYCTEKKLLYNHRSTPQIISFINNVFDGIYPWTEEKLSGGLGVEAPSCVEINIAERNEDNAKESEYIWVLGKIQELIENKRKVWDKKIRDFRDIEFRDIAILLRKKAGKNFPILERQLKEAGIPFVVIGGIGFYREPEIIFLLSLILALIDPSDMYSLWNLISSVYKIDIDKIYKWRDMLKNEEIVDVVERIIKELDFWRGISTQQKANIEKFLMIIDNWRGVPLYTVARNLRTMMFSDEEPKADIFSEHQDAVRVLTVHNAKGLEFPAVFLVNIEDGNVNIGKEDIFYQKTEESPLYKFILKKEADEEYEKSFRQMLEEEEQRVLYVALTRACQYLFISGTKKARGGSIWINMIERFRNEFPATPVQKISISKEKIEKELQIDYIPERISLAGTLTSYTEEKKDGEYYYEGTLIGDIAHKLIYEISKGEIKNRNEYNKRVRFYLKKAMFDRNKKMEEGLEKIYDGIEKISEFREILEIKEGRYSEMPFIVEIEGRIYTGFIDRIVLREDNICCIYDYKMEEGKTEKYKSQMDIYEKAVRKMFPENDIVKRYIVFLKTGKIEEV
ncbi:MAG: UvrD-helicase domain-containing protein [bacterium]|nr:UvrD-helicase domain-containing protein [bacterium]